MKKRNIVITFWFFCCLILTGCYNNKITQEEAEILSDNFQTQIMSLAPLLDLQENGDSLISLISSVSRDVRTNLKIKESKGELVKLARNIISDKDFPKLKNDSKAIGAFIQLNLNDFEEEKMSLIQEYDFVNKLFQFYYWKNWKCDIGRGVEFVTQSLDTMILYEMEEYHIPIFVSSSKNINTPYLILSNSLQLKDKEEIVIKTGRSQNKIVRKEYEVTIFNKITGEEFIEKASVKYKIIKR